MSSKIPHMTLCKTILRFQFFCQTSDTPFFQPQDFCYRKENRLAARRFFEPMGQYGFQKIQNQLVQIWKTWQLLFFSNVRPCLSKKRLKEWLTISPLNTPPFKHCVRLSMQKFVARGTWTAVVGWLLQHASGVWNHCFDLSTCQI